MRLDIVAKVTGAAKYSTDQYLPNLLWAAFIRCPYGEATASKSSKEKAEKVKGVLEVNMGNPRGRYDGDRVGYICAESRHALEEAMAAIEIEWQVGKPKTRLSREKTPLEKIDAPQRANEAAQAMENAPVVIERTYDTQVQTHCSLEPHGGTVDAKGDSAIAWVSTQGTFSVRDDLVRTLQMRPTNVEVHCEYVGGGFGSKFGAGPEGDLAARMSKKYGRPCRCFCSRYEEQTDTGMRPGSMQYMKVAADKSGKILGARIHTWGSVGTNGGGGGMSNPSRYNFGVVAKSHQDVNLNSGGPRAMRAPGHPQGMFAVELMIDELAAELGMDPMALRLKADGNRTRSEMMQIGADMIGWKDRLPNGSAKGVIKRGLGMGVTDWGNGGGRATVGVNIHRDGTVEVLSGSQDIGTGFRTMVASAARSQIGCDRKYVTAKVGDSRLPPGPGSGGSVTSRMVAPKAMNAGLLAKQELLKAVAAEWKTDAAKLSIKDGAITDGQQTLDWEKACKLIPNGQISITSSDDGPFAPRGTGSEGVQFVDLTVDTETGIVRVKKIIALQNVGQAVFRSGVENQITGGVIQGLSFALFENRILNRENGTMVNPNMEFYKIAGSMDIPEIIPIIWKNEGDVSVNSVGEPPGIATPGAIGCAIYNAIGVPVRSMPMTPDKILAALATKETIG